jgi:hypothetical protein
MLKRMDMFSLFCTKNNIITSMKAYYHYYYSVGIDGIRGLPKLIPARGRRFFSTPQCPDWL